MSRRSFLSLAALPPVVAFIPRGYSEHIFQYDYVVGTSLDLAVWTKSASDAERVETAVLEEIARLSGILSTRDPRSEISRIGGAAQTERSHDLTAVFAVYDEWERRTGGVLSIRPEGGHGALNVDALGKAYILDRAAEAAFRRVPEIGGLVLNIGGDIVVKSQLCDLSVTHPGAWHDNANPFTRVSLRDGAIATSGTYLRGAHLLDGRTGLPVSGIVSATVIARDAVTANALAATLCVLPPEEGLPIVERTAGAEAIRIAGDGALQRTSGFARMERPIFVRTAVPANWPAGYQLAVSLTLTDGVPEFGGPGGPGGFGGRGRFGGRGFARRPYVAVWIEDESGKLVRVLAFWASKPRYYSELSSFWSAVGNQDKLYSLARATRPAGNYQLVWDGLDDNNKAQPAGRYRVVVETNQEHGTYGKRSGVIDCGSTPANARLEETANFEAVTLTYGPRPGEA
jgi:FAD:protein FMN transferase